MIRYIFVFLYRNAPGHGQEEFFKKTEGITVCHARYKVSDAGGRIIVEILTPGFFKECRGVLQKIFVEVLDDPGTLDKIGMHDGAFVNPLVKKTAHVHDAGFQLFAAFQFHFSVFQRAPDDAAHHGVDAIGYTVAEAVR